MVANPRKKTSLSRIRPLNQPALVQVQEGEGEREMPSAVVLRDREVRVTSVLDMWEIEDEWWRDVPVARMYYRVALEDGKSITVFRNLVDGLWYQQRP